MATKADKPKAGQKFPTPTPGFGDRVFYETLLRQRPDSAMAQEWCLNYGVLSHKKSQKLYLIVTDRKRKQKSGIATPSSSAARPSKKKARTTVKKEEDPDPVKSSATL